MKKTKSMILVFCFCCMELIRVILMYQGIYDGIAGYPQWQQWLLMALEKISSCGILIGAAAGCFYYELEEADGERERAISVIIGLTTLFVLALLGAIPVPGKFQMSYLVRMGSYFVFPIVIIFFLRKMKERVDVGGHLAYFCLLIIMNLIYISLFQKTGELLMPFLFYQTILECLLVHWIFAEERTSQFMLCFYVLVCNICIYNWYQGRVDFLQQFPNLGRWNFEWNVKGFGVLAASLFFFVVIAAHIKTREKNQQILLLSSGWGAFWEIFLKTGADGIFHMQAKWQVEAGVLLLFPFLAVAGSQLLLEEREKEVPEDEEDEELEDEDDWEEN